MKYTDVAVENAGNSGQFVDIRYCRSFGFLPAETADIVDILLEKQAMSWETEFLQTSLTC